MDLDLRVVKTKKNIANAFCEVLMVKRYDEVVVRDIIDSALVNRSTFYKYYSGKDDLAAKLIEEFKVEYLAVLRERFACTNLDDFINYAEPLLFSKRKILLALLSIKTPRHHLHEDMLEMVKGEFISYARKINPEMDWDYQGTVLSTLVIATARYYFEKDLPISLAKVGVQWRQMMALIFSDGINR